MQDAIKTVVASDDNVLLSIQDSISPLQQLDSLIHLESIDLTLPVSAFYRSVPRRRETPLVSHQPRRRLKLTSFIASPNHRFLFHRRAAKSAKVWPKQNLYTSSSLGGLAVKISNL